VKRVADFLMIAVAGFINRAANLNVVRRIGKRPSRLKKPAFEIPCFLGLMALER
jgi:hypothetical protein